MRLKRYYRSVLVLMLMILFLAAAGLSPAVGREQGIIWGGPPTVRQVALTFDDGPSARYTEKISSILKQYGAQGTFFVLGDHVEEYPRVVQAVIRDGHEVGNHSFSHPRLPESDQLARERELERTSLNLKLLGYNPEQLLFRPPFSAYDDRLVAYLAHTGRRMVLWGIDSGDWQGLDRDTIVKNVVSRVRPGAIIIFHDSDEHDRADRRPTVEALKLILPALQAAGYRMVTISQLVRGAEATPAAKVKAESGPRKGPAKPRLVVQGQGMVAGAL